MKIEKKFSDLGAADKAKDMALWLDEKQAESVVVLDVAGLSPVTDMVVVASAKGVRHGQALADWVLKRSGEEKYEYLGMEGYKNGSWILMDLNDVMVHLFQEEVRHLYNIEGLWAEGARIPFEGTSE